MLNDYIIPAVVGAGPVPYSMNLEGVAGRAALAAEIARVVLSLEEGSE